MAVIRPGVDGHCVYFSDASRVLEIAARQVDIAFNDAADMGATFILEAKDQSVGIGTTNRHILVDHMFLGTNADLVLTLFEILDDVGSVHDRAKIANAGIKRVFQVKDVIA